MAHEVKSVGASGNCGSGKHDVFISYKHSLSQADAKNVSHWCNELGLLTWIDREQIPDGARLARVEVEAILKRAVLASRLTVLFVMQDVAAMNPLIGGTTIVFNWQMLERQYAKELLMVVRPPLDQPYIQNYRDDRLPFDNWQHLAYLLGVVVDAPVERLDRAWYEWFWVPYFNYVHDRSHARTLDFATKQFGGDADGALIDRILAAKGILKLHDRGLYPGLPSIVDPDQPDARRNAMNDSFLRDRADVRDDNLFTDFPET